MAFYVGQYGNPRDGFDTIREYFDNDDEMSQFIAQRSNGPDRIYGLRKAKNLAELLYEWGYGYHGRISPQSVEQVTTTNYNALVDRYGEDKIKEEFPGEGLGKNLFEKIEELDDKQFDEVGDDLEDRDYSKLERRQNWEAAGDEEMRKMDEETGGSWRMEND